MGSDVLPEAGYRGMYRAFTKAMLNRAEIITSKSKEMDEAILAIGDYGKKLERITWGVDMSLFQRVRDVSPDCGNDLHSLRTDWSCSIPGVALNSITRMG